MIDIMIFCNIALPSGKNFLFAVENINHCLEGGFPPPRNFTSVTHVYLKIRTRLASRA